MNDISRKSVGSLIDELFSTNQKCWIAQDHIGDANEKIALQAARDAQALNKRRNLLIAAIDERLGDGQLSPTKKTY